MPTVRLQKQRDFRERDLRALVAQEEANKKAVIRTKVQLQLAKEKYEEWKLENNIQGIDF